MFQRRVNPGWHCFGCTSYLQLWYCPNGAVLCKELTLFYKQLGLGTSSQIWFYIQDFQGSKLLNGCLGLVVGPNVFQSIFFKTFLKLYGPFLLWMGFNCLKATATSRRQFTFYHSVPRNSWYSFYRPRKDERLSQPWSHPVVLITGLPDWESSALTTRPYFYHWYSVYH